MSRPPGNKKPGMGGPGYEGEGIALMLDTQIIPCAGIFCH